MAKRRKIATNKKQKPNKKQVITPYSNSGRKYKDSVIRLLCEDPQRAIEVCNAIAGTNYKPTAEVIDCTVENKLLGRYGDVAKAIENQLFLMAEHMSTPSKNMPMRFLQYSSVSINTFYDYKDLLGKSLVKIPTPKFYVLYNGKEKMPEVMKLSDAFILPDDSPSLEVVVHVVNINYGSGSEALAKSPSLDGYAYFISLVHKRIADGYTRDKALGDSLQQCIDEGILADFFHENFNEVIDMLSYEWSLQDEIAVNKKESKAEGKAEGKDEEKVATALEMIADGMAFEKIAKYVRSTVQWVEDLANKTAEA